MFHTNDTQDFMDTMFTIEDYKWLIKKARAVDASGIEKRCRRVLVEYAQKKGADRQARIAEKATKEAERVLALSKVTLVSDKDAIMKFTRQQLEDQLDIWRNILNTKQERIIKLKSHVPKQGDKQGKLLRVVELYMDMGPTAVQKAQEETLVLLETELDEDDDMHCGPQTELK
ncbi:hypothetical protein AAF712_005487 [Marasmius tenuissimus]|uniref:Uncharacterized protein n=1 Tax=Marasmius tenuissimus TaxID=585030 RepID=A0ABR3A0V4_9AGAR